MKSKELTIERYVITYSNHFIFEGRVLAFRKKELFDLSTGTPTYIPHSIQGWWFGKKLLSPQKAKELIIHSPKEVDVSNLQWYIQEQLNGVFNLT